MAYLLVTVADDEAKYVRETLEDKVIECTVTEVQLDLDLNAWVLTPEEIVKHVNRER